MAKTTWGPEADRRFSTSEIGQKINALVHNGSSSQKRLSEFVLRDPLFVASRGIEELAVATGISASTISRYVRDLDFANFALFRSFVGETVSQLLAPVSKLDAKMRNVEQRNSAVEASIATAEIHIGALKGTETAEQVRKIAKSLAKAERIFVLGFGFSAHLAAILTLALQPYRDNVINVGQYGGTESAAARLMTITKGDLVFAITFPRYSRDIVDLVRFCRDHGANIVALTDSTASPIVEYSGEVLVAPAQHPVITSSNVSALVLIEAIVSEFLLFDPENLARAERLAKAIAAYLTTQG